MSQELFQPELHLFIIWEKAYDQRTRIVKDLAVRFDVVDACEVTWSSELFSSNLTRFYGTQLPDNSFKEKHCGRGPFTLILVRDTRPDYSPRETSKGRVEVNTRTFDAKAQYRKWTGGGHKIHATNSAEETRHDLNLLLGVEPNSQLDRQWDRKIRVLSRDLSGALGWESLQEFFAALNATIPYVVLRNFDGLPQQLPDELHPDIDFLVQDPENFAFITNARKVHKHSLRAMHEVLISGKWIQCDFRKVGDGYYDNRWQAGILRRRQVRNGLAVPSDEDHFYSLLYHVLIHKPVFHQESQQRILSLAQPLLESVSGLEERAIANNLLCAHMSRQGYDFVQPEDFSVGFHLQGIPRIKTTIRGEAERTARGLGKEIGEELSRWLSRKN